MNPSRDRSFVDLSIEAADRTLSEAVRIELAAPDDLRNGLIREAA